MNDLEEIDWTIESVARGVSQRDKWFVKWVDFVRTVINHIDLSQASSGLIGWKQLPFAGGLLDQETINPTTWELWNYIANKYLSVKGSLNGRNDAYRQGKR